MGSWAAGASVEAVSTPRAEGAKNAEEIHPVLPEAGSKNCTQPELRAVTRPSAPAWAVPITSAKADGALRMLAAEVTRSISATSGLETLDLGPSAEPEGETLAWVPSVGAAGACSTGDGGFATAGGSEDGCSRVIACRLTIAAAFTGSSAVGFVCSL
jgi:hypothetical protein